MKTVIARQRLYWNAAKDALVGGDDDAAAILYAAVGDNIPESMVEKFGLVDGALPGFVEPTGDADQGDGKAAAPAKAAKPAKTHGAKEAKPADTKEAPAAPNKEQAPDGDKGADASLETNGTAQ